MACELLIIFSRNELFLPVALPDEQGRDSEGKAFAFSIRLASVSDGSRGF